MNLSILMPFVIGGHLATAPVGVVKYEITSNNSVSHCTATLAKDYNIYSAAHCAVVKGKQEIVLHDMRVEIVWDKVDTDADTAVGRCKTPCRVMPDKLMEVDFSPVKTGDIITLGGFGCYDRNQNIDFKYRTGETTVTGFHSSGFITGGGAIVCEGDSGGMAQKDGKLVGVISAVEPWSHSYLVQPR